jgi:hypothetical protein
MRIIIKAWLLIFLFLFTFPAVGQNQMVKVLDKHTGEPVPFAYVCIESLDKKLRSNNLTDINGTVNITFNSLVQVAVSSVGYKTGEIFYFLS